MAILDVKNVKKIYTTGAGACGCELFSGAERVCGNYGRVRFREDNTLEYFGGS